MSNSEMIMAVAAGLVVLAIIVLIIKFFRQILLATLALAALVVLGIGAYALVSQGQASQEAAKAAKTAAVATTTASAGNLALIALVGVLVVTTVTALGCVGYFWLRARNAEQRDDDGESRWVSGPNALWGKKQPARRIPTNDEALLPLLQQMMGMQAMMMTWMQQLGNARRRPPSEPTQMVFGDGTYKPQLPPAQGQGQNRGYDVLPPEWD